MSQPTTVLWWRQLAIALTDSGPVSADLAAAPDSILAVAAFIQELAPTPKTIRLVYEAQDLEHVFTTCPKASRETLRKTLAPTFPTLGAPTATWSAQRISTSETGSTTILHIDRNGHLARLRSALEERSIRIVNAHALPSLIDCTEATSRPSGPAIALISTDNDTLVYWATNEGQRHLSNFPGAEGREHAIADLYNAFSMHPHGTPVPFLVVTHGDNPIPLDTFPTKPTATLTLADFLGNAPKLAKTDLANLFPPPPPVSSDTIALLASCVFLMAAAACAISYVGDLHEARNNKDRQRAEENKLTQIIETSTATKTAIEKINSELAVYAAPRPLKVKFLAFLSRSRPQQITLRAVNFDGNHWTVTGILHQGVGVDKGPFQAWLAAFDNSTDWSLDPTQNRSADSALFTLNGSFK